MSTILPAITLYQPYASLFLLPAKPWETRPRPCPEKHLGEWVAIHAAASFAPKDWMSETLNEVCVAEFGEEYEAALPRASVIGRVRLGDCVRTEIAARSLKASELATGDFTPGRWAWGKTDVVVFRTPIPAKGNRGWWRFDVGHAA